MPVTSTRQPVRNEGADRGLICLTAFDLSVIKVAHPWYTTICETGSLMMENLPVVTNASF